MAELVDLVGVRCWYEEHGSGEPLVLLHPGGVDARALDPHPLQALAERFRVLTPERRGHGHSPDVQGNYTFEDVADDTARFIELIVGGPARLVGVSDGAMVAFLVAQRRPDLVERMVAIGGPSHWQGWVDEAIDPTNIPPDFMAQMYKEVSPDGPDHYEVVAKKLADMHLVGPSLTPEDLAKIRARTLFMVGDDDEVTLEHAVATYRAIPDAELAVVPRTSHGLLVEKPELVNMLLVDFLSQDPVPTVAPIRRRT
jgi:pimeloyl-ACP methyl ester carboxylesterase